MDSTLRKAYEVEAQRKTADAIEKLTDTHARLESLLAEILAHLKGDLPERVTDGASANRKGR